MSVSSCTFMGAFNTKNADKSATTLLFVHGWATNSRIWKYQLKEFSKEYKVTTIDLPGHGSDDKWGEPSLEPAIEKVSLATDHSSPATNLVGIGWSLGGQALLQTAVKNPRAFRALVLIGTTPKFAADETFPYGQPQGVVKRMLKDIKKDFTKTMERFYPLNFTEEELTGPEAKELMELYHKKDTSLFRESAITSLETLLSADLRGITPDIKIPVLVIHGEKDDICPVDSGRYLAENLPDAKLEIFNGAGHAPFLTRHKEFNEAVQRFIERVQQ